MTDSKKKSPAQFFTEIESVRLTNWSIRMAWKGIALLITFPFRLLAVILLAVMRKTERNRIR